MTVTNKPMSRVPEWLHLHLLPFYAGKLQLDGDLHGQEEQMVNVFQGCEEKASLYRENTVRKCSVSSE